MSTPPWEPKRQVRPTVQRTTGRTCLFGEISEGTSHSAWKSRTSLLRINSS